MYLTFIFKVGTSLEDRIIDHDSSLLHQYQAWVKPWLYSVLTSRVQCLNCLLEFIFVLLYCSKAFKDLRASKGISSAKSVSYMIFLMSLDHDSMLACPGFSS